MVGIIHIMALVDDDYDVMIEDTPPISPNYDQPPPLPPPSGNNPLSLPPLNPSPHDDPPTQTDDAKKQENNQEPVMTTVTPVQIDQSNSRRDDNQGKMVVFQSETMNDDQPNLEANDDQSDTY